MEHLRCCNVADWTKSNSLKHDSQTQTVSFVLFCHQAFCDHQHDRLIDPPIASTPIPVVQYSLHEPSCIAEVGELIHANSYFRKDWTITQERLHEKRLAVWASCQTFSLLFEVYDLKFKSVWGWLSWCMRWFLEFGSVWPERRWRSNPKRRNKVKLYIIVSPLKSGWTTQLSMLGCFCVKVYQN